MSFSDFINEYWLKLSIQLDISSTYLTLFAAILGAVVGVFLSVMIGWITNYFRTISYNQIARMQMKDLTSGNIMICKANIGVLENELLKLNTSSGTMTLTGIANLVDYQPLLLHSPAKFKSPELFLMRMQISALNAHHSQLVNIVKLRDSLTIEIRKAPQKQQEWELIGLRLEYDRYLLNKYNEINSYTKTLNEFLNMLIWQRILVNFLRINKLQSKLKRLRTQKFE